MTVPKNLEITQEQRAPELVNPLMKEQVEFLREEMSWAFTGMFTPTSEQVQEAARQLIPQGKGIKEVFNYLADNP